MTLNRLAVIGGGAAGFFGAIEAKSVNPSLDTIVFEAAPRPMMKIKVSGGGRCNITTSVFDIQRLLSNYPRSHPGLIGMFSRFGPRETVAWFERHGVRLKTEPDGRIFPTSDDSQTVIECLHRRAAELGIRVLSSCPVHAIERVDFRFVINTSGGSDPFDAVFLATGSGRRGYEIARQLGHTVVTPVPSLFTLKIDDPLLSGLAGISFRHVRCRLIVPGERPITQEGALLITHWGLSGPVILRLSAWGARILSASGYRGRLLIDFIPDISGDDLRFLWRERRALHASRQICNDSPLDLPKRFWQQILTQRGIPPKVVWASVSQQMLSRLEEVLKHGALQIMGKGPFKEEFVTAGGVPLDEVDTRSMESRIRKNLFLGGELLNIDGMTGGFNFQNAWSTGWIAGKAIGHRFLDSPQR